MFPGKIITFPGFLICYLAKVVLVKLKATDLRLINPLISNLLFLLSNCIWGTISFNTFVALFAFFDKCFYYTAQKMKFSINPLFHNVEKWPNIL